MPCCGDGTDITIDADIDRCMDTLRTLAYTLKSDSQQRYNKQSRYTRSDNNADEFMEMKEQIVGRLTTVRNMLENMPERGNEGPKMKDGKPRDAQIVEAKYARAIQTHQSAIRTNVRQLHEEFRELENIYKAENQKRRKKYNQEEADCRRMMVEHLQREISAIKTEQMKQYMKDYRPANFNMPTMADAEIFSTPANFSNSPATTDVSAFFGEDLTASQKQSLLTIEERTEAFDHAIEDIGAGVEDLLNLAEAQNEEVKKQNLMLENMSEKVDGVAKTMTFINKRMKHTLKKVGRAGDKLCVDIFCVVLAVGLFSIIWHEYMQGDFL
jgi:hypothetical protein